VSGRRQEHLPERGQAVEENLQNQWTHFSGQAIQPESLLCVLPRPHLGFGAAGLQVPPVQAKLLQVPQTKDLALDAP